jgi:hypothetical protein
LRILGMVVSPRDQRPLDMEREKQRVERAVENLQTRGLVELEWLPGQTWRDLQEAMWGGPWHIFHFIGHGGFDANTDEGFIALADSEGRTNCLSATLLGRLLDDHTALRLALLNSCEGAKGSKLDIFSSTASVLVRRGIPAALAMQYEITDRAAIEFARMFYKALATGMPVDGAVVEGRKAISLAVTNTIEWGTPVLYMRASDGVLFDMALTQPVEAPPGGAQPPASAVGKLELRTHSIQLLNLEPDQQVRLQIEIANTGRAELRGQAESTQPWVKVASTFSCPPGQARVVPFEIDTSDLVTGQPCLAAIALTPAGGVPEWVSIQITIEARQVAPVEIAPAAASIEVNPKVVHIERTLVLPYGESKSITVINLGQIATRVRIRGVPDWLSVKPKTFQLEAEGQHVVELVPQAPRMNLLGDQKACLKFASDSGQVEKVEVLWQSRHLDSNPIRLSPPRTRGRH